MEKLHLQFNTIYFLKPLFKIIFPLVLSTEQFLSSCSLPEQMISVHF